MSAPVRREDSTTPLARLRTTYLVALENAGVIPIISAPLRDESHARQLVQRIDGIVLTGGEDINPARYGAEPHPNLGTMSDERDGWELALVRSAAEQRLPILAICRGIQVLNVALGGSLIQDLPTAHASASGSSINHDPDRPRSDRSHAITIKSDSRVGRALGVTHLSVNSVHHQGVDRVANTLRIVATAPDGTIEAIESAPDSGWWCVGVQWHPEDLVDEPASLDPSLFAAFAKAVRSGAKASPFTA